MTRVAGVIDLIGYLLSGHFLVAPSDLTSPSLYDLWAGIHMQGVCKA